MADIHIHTDHETFVEGGRSLKRFGIFLALVSIAFIFGLTVEMGQELNWDNVSRNAVLIAQEIWRAIRQ